MINNTDTSNSVVSNITVDNLNTVSNSNSNITIDNKKVVSFNDNVEIKEIEPSN